MPIQVRCGVIYFDNISHATVRFLREIATDGGRSQRNKIALANVFRNFGLPNQLWTSTKQ